MSIGPIFGWMLRQVRPMSRYPTSHEVPTRFITQPNLRSLDLRSSVHLPDSARPLLTDAAEQDHNDLCEVCSHGGNLLCCDTCSLVFHTKCVRPELKQIPEGDWSCQFCFADNPNITPGTSKWVVVWLAVGIPCTTVVAAKLGSRW